MVNLLRMFNSFNDDEDGQDLIEYALIAVLIALGAIAGMSTLAKSINSEFTHIAGSLT